MTLMRELVQTSFEGQMRFLGSSDCGCDNRLTLSHVTLEAGQTHWGHNPELCSCVASSSSSLLLHHWPDPDRNLQG